MFGFLNRRLFNEHQKLFIQNKKYTDVYGARIEEERAHPDLYYDSRPESRIAQNELDVKFLTVCYVRMMRNNGLLEQQDANELLDMNMRFRRELDEEFGGMLGSFEERCTPIGGLKAFLDDQREELKNPDAWWRKSNKSARV